MAIYTQVMVFAVVWLLVLLILLPLRLRTQGEEDDVTPGTPSSAPSDPGLRRKIFTATIAAAIIWGLIALVVGSGLISVSTFDVRGFME